MPLSSIADLNPDCGMRIRIRIVQKAYPELDPEAQKQFTNRIRNTWPSEIIISSDFSFCLTIMYTLFETFKTLYPDPNPRYHWASVPGAAFIERGISNSVVIPLNKSDLSNSLLLRFN